MSRISNNKFDRAKVFAGKWARGFIQGLHPLAIAARFDGPRVFINSVPKAGTHLMEQTLGLFPQLRFMGRPTIKHWKEEDIQWLKNIMSGIKYGSFRSGHLEYSPVLENVVDSNSIKMIEVIRDPRDVVISQWKYVTKIDLTHKESKALSELHESDKLLQMMEGVPDMILPVNEVWEMHNGWINKADVLVIKFENLIGSKGGGSEKEQVKTINDIAEFLELSVSKKDIDKIATGIFSETAPTFRKGKIGGWGRYMNSQHKKIIKERLGDTLIKLGYEKNNEW